MTDPIIIIPYQLKWPDEFSRTAKVLREALGDKADRIDHIGSTSVPGLAAKPIIDIQISVKDLLELDTFRIPLERAGFLFRVENPERTKRYFREPTGTKRTHVHVRQSGSWAEQFSLLFRDYLRKHPEDCRRYEEVKHKLAKEYMFNREGYVNAKNPFIWTIMKKADAWSQNIGWFAGEPDA
ncbi:GrpB family protein [Peribacillus deserti]|uniref:GrpB family protein n=1 Tax=Peribacillus deserti TaxID=673318 RepID=A0A2N5M0W1_9BACI|nr:GrpB family protein [Peribacillus deserti]PLT27998.1 hypothetical protein CUU66_20920 [Peribacillus deserti]